jgi:rhodanese-related sulfurtransferase
VHVFGNGVPTVSAAAVGDDAYLLDVRESDEWEAGHVPGSHHLPMHEIPARLDDLPDDREIVVACRVGGRSAQVVAYLRANGRENVTNLDGGLMAWAAHGRPLVTDDGSAAEVI